jgi:hypothetical protein
MSSRDVRVLALGRFLAVERYRQGSQLSSTHLVPPPRPDRTVEGASEFPASRYARRRAALRS